MGGRLIRIGGACLIIGLLGYLALPVAWWYLAGYAGNRYPCGCGEQDVDVSASPTGALPGHMCLALPAAGRIARYQGPPLLPHDVRAALCDVGIIFGGSFVLAVAGILMLAGGMLIGLRRPRAPPA